MRLMGDNNNNDNKRKQKSMGTRPENLCLNTWKIIDWYPKD
jgi:hypothetical protein